MKALLKFIIESIVDHPEAVSIEEENADNLCTLRITVDKNDMGKVIGKQGKIIKAVRTLMKIPAVKQKKRLNVELLEG